LHAFISQKSAVKTPSNHQRAYIESKDLDLILHLINVGYDCNFGKDVISRRSKMVKID
jgi:hypothetical protein